MNVSADIFSDTMRCHVVLWKSKLLPRLCLSYLFQARSAGLSKQGLPCLICHLPVFVNPHHPSQQLLQAALPPARCPRLNTTVTFIPCRSTRSLVSSPSFAARRPFTKTSRTACSLLKIFSPFPLLVLLSPFSNIPSPHTLFHRFSGPARC